MQVKKYLFRMVIYGKIAAGRLAVGVGVAQAGWFMESRGLFVEAHSPLVPTDDGIE